MLLRLSEFSAWTVDAFREMNNEDHRHSVYFDLTTEPNGFQLDDDDLELEEAWQFCICKGQLWRARQVYCYRGRLFSIWYGLIRAIGFTQIRLPVSLDRFLQGPRFVWQ